MHTYIKCVNLSCEKFDEMKNDICLRYEKLKHRDSLSFSLFQRGVIFAYVLGFFTAHQDAEALQIFFNAVENGEIPKIKIIKERDNIKICIVTFLDKKLCEKI